MSDAIEPAKSGRSNCRGCGRKISKSELRFGESLENPYAEGEALVWYHVVCAACMRPEKFGPALDGYAQPIAETDWLRATIRAGLAHPRLTRLVRAERAPSGSAHCRQCRELVPKGSWRLALQMFEEGRMQPIGTIHVQCAPAYFGTMEIRDRLVRLTEALSPTDLAEIERLIRDGAETGATQPASVPGEM